MLTVRSRWTRLALAVLLTAGVSCAAIRKGSGNPPASVIFTNESIDQADVFAAGPNGISMRIGTVMAGRTDTLVLPPAVVSQGGSVSLFARMLAKSFVLRSGSFSMSPGDQVRIRLPSDQRALYVLPDRE
jgi:hypothetical protein